MPIVQKHANRTLDFLLARGIKRKDFCANADGRKKSVFNVK